MVRIIRDRCFFSGCLFSGCLFSGCLFSGCFFSGCFFHRLLPCFPICSFVTGIIFLPKFRLRNFLRFWRSQKLRDFLRGHYMIRIVYNIHRYFRYRLTDINRSLFFCKLHIGSLKHCRYILRRKLFCLIFYHCFRYRHRLGGRLRLRDRLRLHLHNRLRGRLWLCRNLRRFILPKFRLRNFLRFWRSQKLRWLSILKHLRKLSSTEIVIRLTNRHRLGGRLRLCRNLRRFNIFYIKLHGFGHDIRSRHRIRYDR